MSHGDIICMQFTCIANVWRAHNNKIMYVCSTEQHLSQYYIALAFIDTSCLFNQHHWGFNIFPFTYGYWGLKVVKICSQCIQKLKCSHLNLVYNSLTDIVKSSNSTTLILWMCQIFLRNSNHHVLFFSNWESVYKHPQDMFNFTSSSVVTLCIVAVPPLRWMAREK